MLLEAGLVERERRASWAYYRVVPATLATLRDVLGPPHRPVTRIVIVGGSDAGITAALRARELDPTASST